MKRRYRKAVQAWRGRQAIQMLHDEWSGYLDRAIGLFLLVAGALTPVANAYTALRFKPPKPAA